MKNCEAGDFRASDWREGLGVRAKCAGLRANPDSVPGLPKQIHDAQVYPWVPSVNREPHTLIGRLRHVTDDQKTYKNPSLRTQGGQTPSPTKSHSPSPKSPQSHPPKKHAPVLELEGKKWRVEYQEGRNDLVISETELRQVAYIFKCSKSTLQMKGKINSITIDNCKKFGLVFDNVVGIVEVINSKDIQMQSVAFFIHFPVGGSRKQYRGPAVGIVTWEWMAGLIHPERSQSPKEDLSSHYCHFTPGKEREQL
ncbi:hypothetical protein CB1_002763009 [Camelus ferus]|nr:hypothetical protein CB1_002763009 [Camelus ferus]